jgi:hypothetical protein
MRVATRRTRSSRRRNSASSRAARICRAARLLTDPFAAPTAQGLIITNTFYYPNDQTRVRGDSVLDKGIYLTMVHAAIFGVPLPEAVER